MAEIEEKDEKQLQMDEIDQIIQKQFDNMVDLSKIDTRVKSWFDTGVLALNYACSKNLFGGIPIGRVTSINGLSGTGKSLLMASITKDPQVDLAVYIETEGGGAAAELFEFAGVDLRKMRMLKANTFGNYRVSKKTGKIEAVKENDFPAKKDTDKYIYVEGATRLVDRLINSVRFNKKLQDKKIIIILDSLGNMQSVREMSGTPDMGSRAQEISQFFRKFDVAFEQSNISFLFTNKLYTNIGNEYDPFKVTGGVNVEYNPSLEIRLATTSQTDDVSDSDLKEEKDRMKSSIGRTVKTIKATIKKSRFGTEMRNAYFLFDFSGGGPAKYSGLLKLLKDFKIAEQKGSRYLIDGMFENKTFFKKDFISMLIANEKENLSIIQKKLEEAENELKKERNLQMSDIKTNNDNEEEEEYVYDADDIRNAMLEDVE